MKKDENKKEKLSLKERLKDKREKAKIELIFYGVFFVGAIICVKIMGSFNGNALDDTSKFNSFITSIKDNFEYDIVVSLNDNMYHYYGRVLGNNSSINLKDNDVVKSYYLMDNKYYILEDDNYILTDRNEVYPYIDYRYLNIELIKEYLKVSIKENNTYIIKIKDILLNYKSEENIIINIEEGDKNIVIDYTNLFKITDKNIERAIVSVTYDNIGNIISLEE